ncbi:DUF1993 domain-containing protein [Shewanella ulleungensis]|uniref:DUF1993 domain-containing protein n=1 Tax=Shewanella ulleungensis TaxID=2282699 RepID=A0ABQ2QQ98_9GAMM|nr:DUF1993 domain-containing protein [Shewanella ulleungensis]MCL1150312.1 DUF1993 domain-containing protein [Shewanella ulleungensis]GGP88400.1 hypothetical protein GCM10009410_22860 [Shewanella ulleungensis]
MLYDLTVVQFSKMLNNLNHILDKAEVFAALKKVDMAVLLNSRLAPDQFNLIRQVQIACDTAKVGVARLTGNMDTVPKHDDSETTLAELRQRIASVLTYLDGFSEADFSHADKVHVSQPRWEGKYLTGYEFAIEHAVPNIYFHITTAYAILRHNGVEVGKKDYLGAMPYKVPVK